MEVIRIAARVAVPEICPVCKSFMLYDDGRDAYVCDCGFAGTNNPGNLGNADTIKKIAASISQSMKSISGTASITLSVDFRGSVSDQQLAQKLQSELISSIKSAVLITARELQLENPEVHIDKPSIEINSDFLNKV